MTPADAHELLETYFADWVRALQPEVLETGADHVLVKMPLAKLAWWVFQKKCYALLASLNSVPAMGKMC